MFQLIRKENYRNTLVLIVVGTVAAVFLARLLAAVPQSWNVWATMIIASAAPLVRVWMLAQGLWNDRKARGKGVSE